MLLTLEDTLSTVYKTCMGSLFLLIITCLFSVLYTIWHSIASVTF